MNLSDLYKYTEAGDNGCWNWTRSRNSKGYGMAHILDLAPGVIGAHRASYILSKGPVPEGMNVCHTCDNPSCINPDHLWAGTQQDNMRDMVVKGRSGKRARKYFEKTKTVRIKICTEMIRAIDALNVRVCNINRSSAIKMLITEALEARKP